MSSNLQSPSNNSLGDAATALQRTLARCWPQANAAELLLAGLALRAVERGHTCLDLDRLEPDDWRDAERTRGIGVAELRDAARSAPFIGDAAAGLVLVRDGDRRVYLRRYWVHEHALAGQLRARARAVDETIDAATVARLLGAPGPEQPDWQRVALALSLRRRLLVLCGGPGTGKTWTVARMVALWRSQFGPGFRIGLAAPTGKAAARLAEALGADAAGVTPTTLHRLLGMRRYSTIPRHDAGKPLALDALVVDECSMVDLPLMARLLEAVPSAARLVLVGDPDQLPAVESGAVLGALAAFNREGAATPEQSAWLRNACGFAPAPTLDSALAASVLHLRRRHRFGPDSGLGPLLDAIRDGDADAVRARLAGGGDGSILWLQPAQTPRADLESLLREGYAELLAATEPASALRSLGRFRVLCALRDGPSGTGGLNPWIEARLGGHGQRIAQPWLVEANDPAIGLYNGDLGVAMAQAPDQVWFADASGPRQVARGRLPAHAAAWAMTVHKAQGSEFDTVLVLLPPQPHPLLTREWLYTALSRARGRVIVHGEANVLAATVMARGTRDSGLGERLAIGAD